MTNLKDKIAEKKTLIKRHGGFKLIGKYYKTDAEKEAYLKNLIEDSELLIQAAREMLEQRDF